MNITGDIVISDLALPVSATVDTDAFGRGGEKAIHSVFKIIDRDSGSTGTGFLHKSGNVITAEHVVRGELKPSLVLPDGRNIKARIVAKDRDLDLALLSPSSSFRDIDLPPALEISNQSVIKIGNQISTWGFPAGYVGNLPMLSTGVISAITKFRTESGQIVDQWVVNAAFNSGNSGGPLLHIETGRVIGVVSSKLAPISQTSKTFLDALKNNRSGVHYTGILPDGSSASLNESQIIAVILEELRSQVQLVIGMAVFLNDLRGFLEKNGIDP